MLGLAREVKAAFGGRWTPVAQQRLERRWSGGGGFDLEIEDPEGCPRYIAQAVQGIAVRPSPQAWVRKLEALGQRPINNIVDATNLVLFELGQPLHAFDLDRLRGSAIRVRRARAGESMTTLDGRRRMLDPEVLVIADRERPVAIAGLMGGAATEVTAATTSLLLEVAWFEPRRVRRGSRALALSTAASKRYERGVDAEIGPAAAARFLALLGEIVPGITLGTSRERRAAGPAPRTIALRTSRLARLIGHPFTAGEAAEHLGALEFAVARDQAGETLAVTVPSWRPDVLLEDDLVEEVARDWATTGSPRPRSRRAASTRSARRANGCSSAPAPRCSRAASARRGPRAWSRARRRRGPPHCSATRRRGCSRS